MSKTFALIKPDAYESGQMGDVISRIEAKGFHILRASVLGLDGSDVMKLYGKFKHEMFYEDLREFMMSNLVMALALEHPLQDAVRTLRRLIGVSGHGKGHDNQPGTIRGDLAESFRRNVIHASDTQDNANTELKYFFQDDP